MEDCVIFVVPGKFSEFSSWFVSLSSVIIKVEDGVPINVKNRLEDVNDCVGTINRILNPEEKQTS